MRKDSLLKLIVTIAVIIGVFFAFVSPLAYSIRQGLDLQGGTHVVLEAEDTPEAQVNDDAMQRVVKIMHHAVRHARYDFRFPPRADIPRRAQKTAGFQTV